MHACIAVWWPYTDTRAALSGRMGVPDIHPVPPVLPKGQAKAVAGDRAACVFLAGCRELTVRCGMMTQRCVAMRTCACAAAKCILIIGVFIALKWCPYGVERDCTVVGGRPPRGLGPRVLF